MSTTPRPEQFGNFEANIRFLEGTGIVFSGAGVSGPREILEIGTGTGAMLHALLERGVPARGVELRQDLIDEAHRWYGADLPVQRVSGTTLPFPDASFDVVVSLDVLEHIPDTEAHLREVARVLSPGGSYLIQTPNKWMNAIFETIRWRSLKWRKDHCSLHTLGELQTKLARHGFAVRTYDVPVVNDFFREKVRRYAGPIGAFALRLVNPDRLPLSWRTNLYVQATKRVS